MSREIREDYLKLENYIKDYDLEKNLSKPEYADALKKMHKCYFSLVTWHAEMKHLEADFFELYVGINEEITSLLSEVVSDIGSAKFNWLNGAYKVSRIMTRAAIENFIRAISSTEDRSLREEKKVYVLFEKAKELKIFNTSAQVKTAYDKLHNFYVELCKDTHTSFAENMDKITTLADFPLYKKEKSKQASDIFINVTKNILFLKCSIFNQIYHKMHHKNRENIINSIPKTLRPTILIPQN